MCLQFCHLEGSVDQLRGLGEWLLALMSLYLGCSSLLLLSTFSVVASPPAGFAEEDRCISLAAAPW